MGAPVNILLNFFGIKGTLAHLKFRVGQIRDANPGMSERAAVKEAIKQDRSGAPAPAGQGGPKPQSCFVPGTLVLTPGGPQPIEARVVGDKVIAHDTNTGESLPQRVTAWHVPSPTSSTST